MSVARGWHTIKVERVLMTVRDNVHQIIDRLPEERLADVLDYLADLQDEDVLLSPEARTAIEEGLADIRAGRTISLAEYRRTRGL
jgi:PHD/YefM family antitoxin component YafN of YafNO toxin-antitoxin module